MTYYLQVYTWTNTPGQTSVFTACIGTASIGMGEHAASTSLVLYPDPATEQLSMRGMPVGASALRVVDVMGREVHRQRIGTGIDVRAFVTGTYTVIVQDRDGGTLARARFVKE